MKAPSEGEKEARLICQQGRESGSAPCTHPQISDEYWDTVRLQRLYVVSVRGAMILCSRNVGRPVLLTARKLQSDRYMLIPTSDEFSTYRREK